MQNTNTQLEDNAKASEEQVYQSLVRLLAVREHSCSELTRKLIQKGFDHAMVERQLELAKADNLQSDQRFAEMSLRVAMTKGHGPNRFKQKMQQHGIEDEQVTILLNDEEIDWFSLAVEVKIKKYFEFVETDWQKRAKQQRFLLSRGFTFEQINYAVSYNPCSDA